MRTGATESTYPLQVSMLTQAVPRPPGTSGPFADSAAPPVVPHHKETECPCTSGYLTHACYSTIGDSKFSNNLAMC